MDQKALKTSLSQRIIIMTIAILLLGSTVFAYLFIVMANGGQNAAKEASQKVAELTAAYDAKKAEVDAASAPLSDKYFSTFKAYLANAKAYNAATANGSGLKTEDLKAGTGKVLTDGDKDYLAYYIGWCADGKVFQTSFDSDDEPTKLNAPIDPNLGLVEGWNQGVIGMKTGGVRQLTIPSDLAYKDDESAVCGANAPIKFIVLAIEDANLSKLTAELNDLYTQLYAAYYSQYSNTGF